MRAPGNCWVVAWLISAHCLCTIVIQSIILGIAFARISHPKNRCASCDNQHSRAQDRCRPGFADTAVWVQQAAYCPVFQLWHACMFCGCGKCTSLICVAPGVRSLCLIDSRDAAGDGHTSSTDLLQDTHVFMYVHLMPCLDCPQSGVPLCCGCRGRTILVSDCAVIARRDGMLKL